MKHEREVYIDLIGRWLCGYEGFIERIDVDREYSSDQDALNIWVRGQRVKGVSDIRSIEDNRVEFGHGIWINLNDGRKEMRSVNETCASCSSQCKKLEICVFFSRVSTDHNYNEVYSYKLSYKLYNEFYTEDELVYWWDVPDE